MEAIAGRVGDGLSYKRALSGVSALVPGEWTCAAGKNGTYNAVGGTSLAAPQVAGVAALFNDVAAPDRHQRQDASGRSIAGTAHGSAIFAG